MVTANSLGQQKYYTLAEIRSLLPGKRHMSTIHRWMQRGVRGIKLPTILIGGRRYVEAESFSKFLQQINEVQPNSSMATGTAVTTSNLLQAEAILDRERV